ncbi:MAG: glutathione S-transferase family protein [Pseudomonadota bacterium]
MILTIYPPYFGELNASPFCVKALALLHMSGLDYGVDLQIDPRKAPKGKFPVLGDGGHTISDSADIQRHLETAHGVDFDGALSDAERATGHLLRRTMEEHLYFAILAERWIEELNWEVLQKVYFKELPMVLKLFLPGLVRRSTVGQAKAQGVGRHSAAERLDRGRADIDAVAQVLGDTPWLFGDRPTSYDASVASMLRSATFFPRETDLARAVKAHANLVAYMERARTDIMPPLEKLG